MLYSHMVQNSRSMKGCMVNILLASAPYSAQKINIIGVSVILQMYLADLTYQDIKATF